MSSQLGVLTPVVLGRLQRCSRREFKTGGVSIHCAEGPASGPSVVLLHGIPGRWQEFLPIIPHLLVQWHVYALDLRGHGKSDHGVGPYHSSVYGKDLVSFMRHPVATPTVLFGMSAGGLVALDAASHTPEAVRAIVLGDSPIDIEGLTDWMVSPGFTTLFSAFRALAGSDQSIWQICEALAAMPIMVSDGESPIPYGDLPGNDGTHLRQLAVTLKQLDPEVLAYHAEGQAEEYLAGFELDKILETLSCPVLLLQSNPALGGIMTDRSIEHSLERLERGHHVLIEEAGHDLGLERWQVSPLLRAVTAFLESISAL